MLTHDVVKAMAEITGGTQKDAKAHLDAFKAVVIGALERGEGVDLRGFVTFGVKEVAEREARNPLTGETVIVPAHRKATVKLSDAIKKL
jgi:DNA-binding protein HU-beta